ncbi:MAG: hypothetical protein MnENMB40S_14690 [Rhizobiaceae bacterium MnEN-MB40S]|nr:MAG: hypothetical protein MnENMB40S_14690 [Rhizobiaceae bacterium MnEN-MB40S]
MVHDLVPSIILDKSIVGEKQVFDAWREQVRECYDIKLGSDQPSSRETLKAWLIDSLIFTDVAFSSQSFSHCKSHLRNSSDYLSLQIYSKGRCRGIVDKVSFDMLPGEVHVFDFSREFNSYSENSGVFGVALPHKAIGYDPGRHPAYFKFPSGSPITHLLIESVFAVLDRASQITTDEAGAISEGFCGLLKGLLGITPLDEPLSPKLGKLRSDAMKEYLEKHLADPDLNVERLSKQFGVSIPTVYRDFAEIGGVSHYIMQRRLDRAFSRLVSGPSRYGKVQDVSMGLGFEDPAYFSRLFRQRFGFTPTFVMNMNKSGHPSKSDGKNHQTPFLGDWFKSIS